MSFENGQAGRCLTLASTVDPDGLATYIQVVRVAVSSKDIRLVRLRIGLRVVDQSVEILAPLTIARGAGGAATGPTLTPAPMISTDSSTIMTSTQGAVNASNIFGAGVILIEDAINIRFPYDLMLAPDERPSLKESGDRFIIRINPSTTIPTTAHLSVTAWLEEVE